MCDGLVEFSLPGEYEGEVVVCICVVWVDSQCLFIVCYSLVELSL